MIRLHETGNPSSSSQPTLMATMLELLDLHSGMKVLEVGTGTGYNTALLAELVEADGHITSIDNQADLIATAQAILSTLSYEQISFHVGDGTDGFEQNAPYDRIICTAGSQRVPEPLLEQLAQDAKMVIPVGNGGGLLLVQKTSSGIRGKFVDQMAFFMPLVDELIEYQVQAVEQLTATDIKSLDFRFFMDWVTKHEKLTLKVNHPEIHCIDQDDNLILLLKHSRDSSHAIDAHLMPNDSSAKQILNYIQDWIALGKPERTAFSFYIDSEGNQIVELDEGLKFHI